MMRGGSERERAGVRMVRGGSERERAVMSFLRSEATRNPLHKNNGKKLMIIGLTRLADKVPDTYEINFGYNIC